MSIRSISSRRRQRYRFQWEQLEKRRALAAGDLDPTFGTGGLVTADLGVGALDYARDFAVQTDQKIVTVGLAAGVAGQDLAIARFLPDGSLDSSFGANGSLILDAGGTEDYLTSVAIQTDGKIVAGGARSSGTVTSDFLVIRLNSNGSLDASFGTGGMVFTDFETKGDGINGLDILPDGRIIVAGFCNYETFNGNEEFAAARYLSNGNLDGTFGVGGRVKTTVTSSNDSAQSIVVQPDGKIVLGGIASRDTTYDFGLVRYMSDGALDASFGVGGIVDQGFGPTSQCHAVTLKADGKIVAVGWASIGAGNLAIAQYNTDGSPDLTFSGDGRLDFGFGYFAECGTVIVQQDGRIIVGGYSPWAPTGAQTDFVLVRLNADGTFDPDFGTNGVLNTDFSNGDDRCWRVRLVGNNLVAVGHAFAGGDLDTALARYLLNSPPTANAGGSYIIAEGDSLPLTAAASSDPENDPLTFIWDVNGDGIYGDAIGETPTLTWAQLCGLTPPVNDGPAVFNVTVRVSDGVNPPVDATTMLTVSNMAPTASLSNSGPVSEGGMVTVSFSNQLDPSPADTAAGFLYSFDWNNDGDFTDPGEIVDSPSPSASHVFDDNGSSTVRGRIMDKDGGFTDYTTSVIVTNGDMIVTAFDKGGDSRVRVMDAETLIELFNFTAFDLSFRGGVRVAVGDVTGDRIGEIICAPGKGKSPGLRLFDGVNGTALAGLRGAGLQPFGTNYKKGYWLAAADFNDDNITDIVCAPTTGFDPVIKVLSGVDGTTELLNVANGFPTTGTYRKGVRVGAEDVNGDGTPDIIAHSGLGTDSRVRIFSGIDGTRLPGPFAADFNPFADTPSIKGPLFVAGGDLNGDGNADLIIASGKKSTALRTFDGATGEQLNELNPAEAPAYKGGIRVGTTDADGDGDADIVTGTGKAKGLKPHCQVLDGQTLQVIDDFFIDPSLSFQGGGLVAGGR